MERRSTIAQIVLNAHGAVMSVVRFVWLRHRLDVNPGKGARGILGGNDINIYSGSVFKSTG